MNNFTNLLAVHCHTTGMNFNGVKTEGHQALSVALAVLDLDSLAIVDNITIFIKPDPSIKWNADLQKIHGIDLEMAESGVTTEEAAAILGTFIAKHFNIDKKVPVFGYNVNNFHLPFLEKVLHSEELYFKFDERAVDLFPISTLLGTFGVYDTIERLFGKKNGPIGSEEFIKYYTKIYKMARFLVQNSIGS
jgi:DNA polymerase III epsilon subunit-like protein